MGASSARRYLGALSAAIVLVAVLPRWRSSREAERGLDRNCATFLPQLQGHSQSALNFHFDPLDDSFHGMRGLNDRESVYAAGFDSSIPVKCGFTGPPIALVINTTCTGTVLFTALANCYDPLPRVVNMHLAECRVALVDSITLQTLKTSAKWSLAAKHWDLIELKPWPGFISNSSLAEFSKALGARMFPRARVVVWADGKTHFDLALLLKKLPHPLVMKPLAACGHKTRKRTMVSEFKRTKDKFLSRGGNLTRFIEAHELQYKKEHVLGYFEHFAVPDIAVMVYSPQDPRVQLALCAWFAEMITLSPPGQLSLYYALNRLRLLGSIYQTFPTHFVYRSDHERIC